MSEDSRRWACTQRLLTLLAELVESPVARREFRYQPEIALRRRGWIVPAPASGLPVRSHGLSLWLSEQILFGRDLPTVDIAPPPDAGLLLFTYHARSAALSFHPESSAEQLVARAWRRGWVGMLGPYALTPDPDPDRSGFADVASAVWSPTPGSGGHRPVIIARTFDHAAAIWLALLFSWDRYLGQLLGYPACCCAAFPSRWAEARRANGDVAAALLTGIPEGSTHLMAPECNIFVRVLGAELPLHFPCTLHCSATIDQVQRQLEVLTIVDARRAERTGSLLSATTVIGARGEVSVSDRRPDLVTDEWPRARVLVADAVLAAESLG